MGILQLTVRPVQPEYVVYVTPSFRRISTLYPVIGVLPDAGATQVIVTSVPWIAVIGAAGALGAVNTAPFPAEDKAELPMEF